MVMITKKPQGKGLDFFLYSVDEKLHEPGLFNDTLDKLEQRTGLKRLQVVAGMLLVYSILLLFGPWAGALCNLSGFLHPAHATAKAIETGASGENAQVLLAYWLLYSLLSVVESLPGRVLIKRVPAYWLLKCAFLLYLHSPVSMGARKLRQYFLKSISSSSSASRKGSTVAKKYSSVVEPSINDGHRGSYEKRVKST